MAPSLDQAVQLTEAYRRALNGLRSQLGVSAQRAWLSAAGDPGQWARLTQPLAVAGRRRTAATVAAYHGHLLGRIPTIDPIEIIDADMDRWDQPIVALEADKKLGLPLAAALAAGVLRAASAAATDITTAERSTAQLIDIGEPRITGYWRTLSPKACRWCAEVATQRYRSAETAAAPNHDGNCHCGLAPCVDDLEPGRVINRGLLDQVRSTDSAYVTDTGEPADRPDAKAPDTGD